MMAAPTVGSPESEHGFRVRTPLGPRGGTHWYATEQQAHDEFQNQVNSLREESEGPGLFKVQRIEKRSVVDEEIIVRRPPTYR